MSVRELSGLAFGESGQRRRELLGMRDGSGVSDPWRDPR